MSPTFLVALAAALIAIIYWRAVLIIVGALLLAMIATGISTVSAAVAGQEVTSTVIGPAEPGVQPGRDAPDASGGGAIGGFFDPRSQEQP
jgi:hypothetical protein